MCCAARTRHHPPHHSRSPPPILCGLLHSATVAEIFVGAYPWNYVEVGTRAWSEGCAVAHELGGPRDCTWRAVVTAGYGSEHCDCAAGTPETAIGQMISQAERRKQRYAVRLRTAGARRSDALSEFAALPRRRLQRAALRLNGADARHWARPALSVEVRGGAGDDAPSEASRRAGA